MTKKNLDKIKNIDSEEPQALNNDNTSTLEGQNKDELTLQSDNTASNAVDLQEHSSEEDLHIQNTESGNQNLQGAESQEKQKNLKKDFLQFLKFLAFSLSAGVIQILSFELLYTWTKALPWWPSYLISVALSVIWNFTFNRKFTFKSATNVPLAMTLVFLFYCAFTPASVFGGDALEGIGWNGTLVTFLMMVINFITEFFYDKFVVFNDKVINKILSKFSRSKSNDGESKEGSDEKDEKSKDGTQNSTSEDTENLSNIEDAKNINSEE